jgi:hypothetical protein
MDHLNDLFGFCREQFAVSTNDRIFFGQRWRDNWAAPYNAAAFERLARRYFHSPGWARFYTILGVSLTVFMFLGAGLFFAFGAKSRYLDAYGVETPGRILHSSFHTDYRKNKWKKLDYEFKTIAGDMVEGQLDRPVYELTNLPGGDRLTVLYWDWFPAINAPRGVKSNFGIMMFVAVILLLGGVNYTFLSRRMLRWRKSLAAEPAA